jgi:hypothetical protein
MKHAACLVLLAAALAGGTLSIEGAVVDKHVMVYYEPGRFGGWPANHGIWSWGNEILVGFSAGYYKDQGPGLHAIDREKPQRDMLARSLDGGKTWTIEDPAEKGVLDFRAQSVDCPGNINFTHPDFAMRVRMLDINVGPSFFHYSYDRGRTWEGPFSLPQLDTPGIAARTDYLVNGQHDCMLFLTAGKSNRREGRPLCVRTTDGGKTWTFVAWIGPEPKGFAIMPASSRLSEYDILAVVRCRQGRRRWLSAYLSQDDGGTWRHLNDPVSNLGEGNPPALIKLRDGRLCVTYGVRAEPYRICAKLSDDAGRTWSDEIVLRDDGAAQDLGYTRSVQRLDGKIVTVYYFNDAKTGPERYIAATLWDPR